MLWERGYTGGVKGGEEEESGYADMLLACFVSDLSTSEQVGQGRPAPGGLSGLTKHYWSLVFVC